MKPIPEYQTGSEIAAYLHICIDSICRILEQGTTKESAVQQLPSEESEASFRTLAESGVWMHFVAPEAGQQAFVLSAIDALQLSQLLRNEPLGQEAELDQDHLDNLVALFSQAVNAAARSLVTKLGREVRLEFGGNKQPPWAPATQASFRLHVSPNPPLLLSVQLSPEFVDTLKSIEEQGATPRSGRQPARASSATKEVGRDTNIDLLMDVELGASLRFGERRLLLKEVLELGPGSLIELDQQVADPVELVVGNRVVARGDVVVVDGNYGLRVTEIASARERIESLGGTAGDGVLHPETEG